MPHQPEDIIGYSGFVLDEECYGQAGIHEICRGSEKQDALLAMMIKLIK